MRCTRSLGMIRCELERPRQPVVQSGRELGADDPAEPHAQADLARLHREQPAAHVQHGGDRERRQRESDSRTRAALSQPAKRSRSQIHSPGTCVRRMLSSEQRDQQQRAGDLHRLRNECGGRTEGRARIDSPGPIHPVERKAGQQRDDRRSRRDRSPTMRAPRNLVSTTMLPMLVAGPASRNTSAAPGFSPFMTSAAATRCRFRCADVDRDADEQHHEHRHEARCSGTARRRSAARRPRRCRTARFPARPNSSCRPAVDETRSGRRASRRAPSRPVAASFARLRRMSRGSGACSWPRVIVVM